MSWAEGVEGGAVDSARAVDGDEAWDKCLPRPVEGEPGASAVTSSPASLLRRFSCRSSARAALDNSRLAESGVEEVVETPVKGR